MPHVTQDLLARGTTYSPRPVLGNLLGGRRDLSFGIYGRADEARRLLDEKWSGESLPGKIFSTLLGDDRTKTDAGTKWGHHLLQGPKRLVSSIATSDALWAVLMCYNSRAESDLPFEMRFFCLETWNHCFLWEAIDCTEA